MLLPDPSIDVASLAALLRSEFGTEADLSFVPVGGDSWNYRAGPWWLSVRRDRQGHFPGSYEAACQLREAGLAFVLAPYRGRSGRVVFLAGGRPVIVSPFVSHRSSSGLSLRETEALRQAVESLHSATVGAPVPREMFELPFAAELDAAVARAEAGASGAGTFGGDVSELVQRNRERIAAWREEIRTCQLAGRRDAGEFVLTHGEPAPPNVIVSRNGQLLLLDWGDLLWAPPERDALGLAEVGIHAPGRPHVKRFYELRWILGEVAEYVVRLTDPHEGTAEDAEKRRELARYLS